MVRKPSKEQVVVGWETVSGDAASTLKNNMAGEGHWAVEMVSKPGGKRIF